MKSKLCLCLAAMACTAPALAGEAVKTPPAAGATTQGQSRPSEVVTTGSVTVDNQRIAYHAHAGTLVVHPGGWDDAAGPEKSDSGKGEESGKATKAEAEMFYVAYFKDGAPAAARPITFVFNGGPGSPSLWLHMTAFGPVRVAVTDTAHSAGAPYPLVSNQFSLLGVSDLVFIDAPGTGFSRITGKDKDKAFYGVDQDIHAFAEFIRDFLSKYGRWNSPKYVFGESYGTMRGAGLALELQQHGIDLNGLMLLSTILNWDTMPDDPQFNPGIDTPYIVSLPTYAATAWYHHRLPAHTGPLRPFLDEVETFATGDYAQALIQGNALPEAERKRIASRLSDYTGLTQDYLLKTNLRIEYGAFQKELLADQASTTGTLDTRFTGFTLDPLSKVASHDPSSSAVEGAVIAGLNTYMRTTLRYGEGRKYETDLDVYSSWDYRHRPPGAERPLIALPNVLPDLASAMKQNPRLKVLVLGGYYDVSTPYFEGRYELRHLPVPGALQGNISYRYYPSGHMVYLNPEVIGPFSADVNEFIRATDNLP